MGENNELVKKAILGDKKSLTKLIKSVENLVYNLSIKMLWHPQNAEDASQEILIRVITNLKSFRGQSKFSTWVYRLATNHLSSIVNQRNNKKQLSFTDFTNELQQGLSNTIFKADNEGEQKLLIQEMKIGCTNGMLQCLDIETRTSYILGDILEFNSTEGAYIQNVKPATFRKRLSRARNKLFTFMDVNRGIAKSSNKCHCKKQISHCVQNGKLNSQKLLFAIDGADIHLKNKIENAENSMHLFNSNPQYKLPTKAVLEIRRILRID